MTTQSFTLAGQRELQARFHTATLNMNAAVHRARNLAAQLEAERALLALFAARRGVRPQ
jgi:hypothetical protein